MSLAKAGMDKLYHAHTRLYVIPIMMRVIMMVIYDHDDAYIHVYIRDLDVFTGVPTSTVTQVSHRVCCPRTTVIQLYRPRRPGRLPRPLAASCRLLPLSH
jgi:hypothetical protein